MARRPVNIEDFSERVRALLEAANGLSDGWLRETANQAADALLELAAWRANGSQSHSERVRRDLAIVAANASLGQTIDAKERIATLRQRFGVSRATIFRVLSQSHQRETVEE